MKPQRHEVWLARVRLGMSTDVRPCIVLNETSTGSIKVVPVSAATTLRSGSMHFLIRSDHPDFPATGLRRESYAIGNEICDLELGEFVKKLGQLVDDLMLEFDDWIGE